MAEKAEEAKVEVRGGGDGGGGEGGGDGGGEEVEAQGAAGMVEAGNSLQSELAV